MKRYFFVFLLCSFIYPSLSLASVNGTPGGDITNLHPESPGKNWGFMIRLKKLSINIGYSQDAVQHHEHKQQPPGGQQGHE